MFKKLICLFITIFLIMNNIVCFAEEKTSGREIFEKSFANIDILHCY